MALQSRKEQPACHWLIFSERSEGAIVTAVIQGNPVAADVARDAALKLVAEA